MTEDEEFFAWLDGELTGEAAERVAARVAASPDLAARAEQHRRMAADFRAAFDPVMTAETTPPRFQAAEIVDFGARAAVRKRGRSWLDAPQWAMMAASLAIGLVVGSQFLGTGNQSTPVVIEDGRLVAAADLKQALDSRLASAPATAGPRVGLTFRDASGHVCRSFADATASGLACRDRDSWQLRGLFPAAGTQVGSYRMAAGEDPRLAALIGETIRGEPFDAMQEKAALESGWR